jgi:hypothetical protein
VCAVTTKATGDPEHMSDIDSSTLSTTSAAQAFIDARRFPALTIPVDDDLLIIIPADDDALCPAIAVEVNDQLSSPMSTTLAIGISDPATLASAPVLWHRAQIAARFSGIDDLGFGAAVSYSELGALAFLAEQDPAAVRAHPAIKALSALAEKPHGAEDLRLLRAFISSGSLRRAAKELHLHHSSVSAAALRIQETLGVSATSPVQRLATLATLIAYDLSTARASIIP